MAEDYISTGYTSNDKGQKLRAVSADQLVSPPVGGQCPRCAARLHELSDRTISCVMCGYQWEGEYRDAPMRSGHITDEDFRMIGSSRLTEAIGLTG